MAVSEYKPVSWVKEPVTAEKLSQMANNEQWLYEHNPKVMYNAYGTKRDAGIKIMACSLILPATSFMTSATFYFGNFFTPGTVPIVVSGLYPQRQTSNTIQTLGGLPGKWTPDSSGFTAWAWSEKGFVDPVIVHAIAIGI